MKKYIKASTDVKQLDIIADRYEKVKRMMYLIEDLLHEAHYDLELNEFELKGLESCIGDCLSSLQLFYKDYDYILKKL